MQTHISKKTTTTPVQRKPEKASPVEVLQRIQPLEEEELLQGKFGTAQRMDMEEEELLQGKFKPVQRQELEEEELLQGKFQPIQRQANNTGLPDNLKSGIENLSGHAMDDVKVHYNSDQPAQLNAHAYAQGTDIHLGPGQEKHLPHEAWHVVQQKQGRVRPTMQMKGKVNVNDDVGLEREADVMGARAKATKPQRRQQLISKSTINTGLPVQGLFYERTAAGKYVHWKSFGKGIDWHPWIDPDTGEQESFWLGKVYFRFDKSGLDRQKVKGVKGSKGRTTGITLAHVGGVRRNWPDAMKSKTGRNAEGERRGVSQAIQGESAWGHQLAHQWGGPFEQRNASSATNSGKTGEAAQELYQTAAEDAVTNVAEEKGRSLKDFRLKHTAYNYPGKNIAKYMRFKIYAISKTLKMGWYKVLDQVTPEFALFLKGGKPDAARNVFRASLENQLRKSWFFGLKSKKGTDPNQEVMSTDSGRLYTDP